MTKKKTSKKGNPSLTTAIGLIAHPGRTEQDVEMRKELESPEPRAVVLLLPRDISKAEASQAVAAIMQRFHQIDWPL